MKRNRCEREIEVVDALRTGASTAELDGHLRTCAVCAETRLVAGSLLRSAAALRTQQEPPLAGQVWRRAQARKQEMALRRATRPLIFMRAVSERCLCNRLCGVAAAQFLALRRPWADRRVGRDGRTDGSRGRGDCGSMHRGRSMVSAARRQAAEWCHLFHMTLESTRENRCFHVDGICGISGCGPKIRCPMSRFYTRQRSTSSRPERRTALPFAAERRDPCISPSIGGQVSTTTRKQR